MFASLMSQMLEAVRWPPESWDSSSAAAPGSGAGGRGRNPPSPASSPSFAHDHAAANEVATTALAAHPSRRLYLSGESCAFVRCMHP